MQKCINTKNISDTCHNLRKLNKNHLTKHCLDTFIEMKKYFLTNVGMRSKQKINAEFHKVHYL